MADADDFDDELDHPGAADPIKRAVGDFIISWGILERELDTAFPVIFHTDPTLACCIYANLGTKAKLDMLSSAVSMHEKVLGRSFVRSCHKILSRISDLSDRARNTLAHGQVHPFVDELTGKFVYELIRHVARKSHAMVVHPGTSKYWKRQDRMVVSLARAWRKKTARIHRKTKSLTAQELDEICVTHLREHEPIYLRRRQRLTQPKGALKDRRAKRAPWPREPFRSS